MLTIIEKIIWIFVMIAIGFFLNKKDIIPYSVNKYLIQILLLITTPCMITQSLLTREITEDTFAATMQVLIGSVVFFAIAIGLSYVIGKSFKLKDKDNRSVYMVLMTSVNTAFMGFPVTKAIFGDQLFYFMVIQNIILTLYLYTLMPMQFNIGSGKTTGLGKMMKKMVNPCTVAALGSVILLFCGFKLPESISNGLGTIGDMTTPLSMIVVGIELGQSRVLDIIKNRHLDIATFVSLVVMPALTLLLVYWLPLATEAKAILVFAAAFPVAVITVPVSIQENKDSKLAAEGVALTTFFSLITIPMWALIINALVL